MGAALLLELDEPLFGRHRLQFSESECNAVEPPTHVGYYGDDGRVGFHLNIHFQAYKCGVWPAASFCNIMERCGIIVLVPIRS